MSARRRIRHMILGAVVLITLGAAESSVASEPIKAGPEILVSTDSYYYEGSPRIASDPFGNFLVMMAFTNGVGGYFGTYHTQGRHGAHLPGPSQFQFGNGGTVAVHG